MKKIFGLISLGFFAFACSNEIITEVESVDGVNTKEISVTVSANGDGTNTRVSMDNSNVYASTWSATWDEGDALAAWVDSNNGIVSFAMDMYDSEAARFVGTVSADANNIRLVYPYSTAAADGTLYPVNIASQTDGASSLYLVSEDLIAVDGEEKYSTPSMKQVGAFFVLTTSFSNVPEGLTVKSVELCDVPTSLSIDMTKTVDADGFYGTATNGNITISDLDFAVADGNLQITFNVLPYVIASGSDVTFKFNFMANGVGYTTTASVTNTGSDLTVERATHNYINLSCDCSNISVYEDGSVNAPYLIYTAADMVAMSDDLSASYVLMNDIDLDGSESNQWTPIGTSSSSSFTGSFDGGFNTIKGLYINAADSYQALFGYATQADIRNVVVEGSVTSTKTYVAGIVAYMKNSKNADPSYVVNCINRVNVTGTYYVAGVCAYSQYPSYFVNCGNEATIVSTYASLTWSGGIVGCMHTGKLINSYNTGDITFSGYYGVGGVAYSTTSAATLENCYSASTYTCNYTGTNNLQRIGGVAGTNVGSCYVTNCYYDSTLYTAEHDADNYCGGAVGFLADDSETTVTGTYGMSTTDMQAESFVATLNENVASYNSAKASDCPELASWKYNEGGYPVLDLGFDENQIEGSTSGIYFGN